MEKYAVISEENILKVFNSEEDADEYAREIDAGNIEEAQQELGYDEDDVSEKHLSDAAMLAGYGSGVCEVFPVDLDDYDENDTICLGDNEFSYEDVKEKFDKAE